MRAAIALVLALAVAACGQSAELRPKPGGRQPAVPYGREEPLPPESLLRLPPQAAPERSTELRRRSEERQDDPFDLPPAE